MELERVRGGTYARVSASGNFACCHADDAVAMTVIFSDSKRLLCLQTQTSKQNYTNTVSCLYVQLYSPCLLQVLMRLHPAPNSKLPPTHK